MVEHKPILIGEVGEYEYRFEQISPNYAIIKRIYRQEQIVVEVWKRVE